MSERTPEEIRQIHALFQEFIAVIDRAKVDRQSRAAAVCIPWGRSRPALLNDGGSYRLRFPNNLNSGSVVERVKMALLSAVLRVRPVLP
jgi:hypothetical protein